MADLPDLNEPWPDLGHEAIRQVTVQHIATLADHLQQLQDSFLIGQTTAEGLLLALSNVVELQQQVTNLQARVAALEAANPPLADAAGAVQLGGSATATSEP